MQTSPPNSQLSMNISLRRETLTDIYKILPIGQHHHGDPRTSHVTTAIRGAPEKYVEIVEKIEQVMLSYEKLKAWK